MTATPELKPIPERLERLRSGEIELKVGSHSAPAPDCTHPDGCDREIRSWVLGLPWGDDPEDCSPVINAFRRRFNDTLPKDLRQKLEETMFDDIGTRGDGRDEDRGWMCADWTIRVALPTWLELAGTTDAATQLRELPEITAETIGDARPLVNKLRDEGWEFRQKSLAELRAKVREAVEKEIKAKGGSAAEAAGAAEAAEAAGAAGAAWAARQDLRARVRKAVREAVTEKLAPTQQELFPSAIDLLKRMCELEPAK